MADVEYHAAFARSQNFGPHTAAMQRRRVGKGPEAVRQNIARAQPGADVEP